MLLSKTFPDPSLNLTLEVFLRDLHALFGSRLLSAMLYGSLVHGDLAPGYGDLDFVVVIDGGLDTADRDALVQIRTPLRSGTYGDLAAMLEGAFLTREMLCPRIPGDGFWWGTTRERPIDHNHLGWFNLLDLKENGIVIFGMDLRTEIPAAQQGDLVKEIRDAVRMMRQQGSEAGQHLVDWLLQCARYLSFLNEGRLFSKSEAAEWAEEHATGSWRHCLKDCSRYRRDSSYRSKRRTKQWLKTLHVPLEEACDELEMTLAHSTEGCNT